MINNQVRRLFHAHLRIVSICVLLLLIAAAGGIVYLTGGTEFSFTHLMYIPILLAAFLLDVGGAIAAALLGGFALGPFMPMDVPAGVAQTPFTWIFRTAFFLLIGLIVALMFRRIKRDKERSRQKAFLKEVTGLPNARKLKLDLSELIRDRNHFSLLVFRISNLDHINIYVDYSVGEEALFFALEILKNLVEEDLIYSVYTNEFAVILAGHGIDEACNIAREFLNFFEKPIYINDKPVGLTIKCGISNYPLHSKDPNDLFKKMERTLDQDVYGRQNIAVYEDSISMRNKAKYETVVSLFEAIKENRFSMVYQPIIHLGRHEMKGAEALLRWDNNQNMCPGEFIKIAEEAGIIGEITKCVIKNVIDQLKTWQDAGFFTKISVNISSKDLRDGSFLDCMTEYMRESGIAPSTLEFELTERVLIENETIVGDLLNRIKNIGIKISLDDFGTGYNSLISLIRLPIDYLKLDKIFMEHINQPLVEEIIHLAHSLGIEVIAEGVETKQQLSLLEKIGCDNIQGFYFSRPLPPEELRDYYLGFHKKL